MNIFDAMDRLKKVAARTNRPTFWILKVAAGVVMAGMLEDARNTKDLAEGWNHFCLLMRAEVFTADEWKAEILLVYGLLTQFVAAYEKQESEKCSAS